jgi:hypothetical protein
LWRLLWLMGSEIVWQRELNLGRSVDWRGGGRERLSHERGRIWLSYKRGRIWHGELWMVWLRDRSRRQRRQGKDDAYAGGNRCKDDNHLEGFFTLRPGISSCVAANVSAHGVHFGDQHEENDKRKDNDPRRELGVKWRLCCRRFRDWFRLLWRKHQKTGLM